MSSETTNKAVAQQQNPQQKGSSAVRTAFCAASLITILIIAYGVLNLTKYLTSIIPQGFEPQKGWDF